MQVKEIMQIKEIFKRNHTKMPFQIEKITEAVLKAMLSVKNGSPKDAEEIANKVCFFNTTSSKCITIHSYGLRSWDLDLVQKKVKYTDILTNQIKRVYTCCVIDPTDQFAYIGTKTGDIMEINLQNNLFKRLVSF